MSDTITLISIGESENTEQAMKMAARRAETITKENIKMPGIRDHTTLNHPSKPELPYALPTNTAAGNEALQKALDQTRTSQLNALSSIVNSLNETSDYTELLEDKDFRHDCWRLGSDNSPLFSLYDATGWNSGSAIHSQNMIDTILNHTSHDTYIVKINVE